MGCGAARAEPQRQRPRHIAAVLADAQGTPRVPWNDYRTARTVCQELEAKWGLTVTAAADRTAHRAVTRGETERAVRDGLAVPVRVRIEAEVRAAAAVSRDFGEMQRVLAGRGIIATEVHKPSPCAPTCPTPKPSRRSRMNWGTFCCTRLYQYCGDVPPAEMEQTYYARYRAQQPAALSTP